MDKKTFVDMLEKAGKTALIKKVQGKADWDAIVEKLSKTKEFLSTPDIQTKYVKDTVNKGRTLKVLHTLCEQGKVARLLINGEYIWCFDSEIVKTYRDKVGLVVRDNQ